MNALCEQLSAINNNSLFVRRSLIIDSYLCLAWLNPLWEERVFKTKEYNGFVYTYLFLKYTFS